MATYVSQGVYQTDNTGLTAAPPEKGGERQDLWDVVTRIDPADAPFMNNSPKSTGTAVIHDWQVQELADVSQTAMSEGFDVETDNSDADDTPSDRLFNIMTIRKRRWKVSDTMDGVSHAGHAAMSVRQRTLKALELRKDVEASLLDCNVAKSGADPRQAAGLGLFILNGSGGATPTLTLSGDGTGTGMTDDGTAVNLALDTISSAMQACYEDGGQPNLMYMSPSHKRVFSSLDVSAGGAIAAQNRFNMTAREPATYIGAVDIYLTDFGTLECVIDRFIPVTATAGVWTTASGLPPIYLVDNRHVGYVSLRGRNFKNQMIGKTGDNESGIVVSEFCLRSNAPKAHAVLFAQGLTIV